MNRTATKLPVDIGPIHFVGIGGIGMSGIAEVLLNLGYDVQGSDMKSSPITERLAERGAQIFVGQKAGNLEGAEVVVISSAIKPGNPELDAARDKGLPVVRRAEMLAELMRLKSNVAVAGTHGKTTTTSMVAALLDAGEMDPTVINGGIIHSYGSNARMGTGEWMVVEADESDGTFTKLPATIAIVTNIDPEHLDHYGDFEGVKAAFETFVSNIPFYGVAVCCIDHPEVQALVGRIHDRRVITYGFNPQADVRIVNLTYKKGVAHFDIALQAERSVIAGASLPMPGDHNVSNALAAVAVSRHLGVSHEQIKAALSGFGGVNRRFTRVGEVTRLDSLFEEFCSCFNDADVVAISDVFEAGESPIAGADREGLVAGLKAHGHKRPLAVSGEADLPAFFKAEAKPGDLFVCMGAGTISAWAHGLMKALE